MKDLDDCGGTKERVTLDVEGFPEVRSREELDPKVLYENEMSGKLLAEAVSSLKPKYSIVLMLRYSEACSYEEIGTHLGLSMKAVDTRLYRAKKQLRRKLELLGIKENPFYLGRRIKFIF